MKEKNNDLASDDESLQDDDQINQFMDILNNNDQNLFLLSNEFDLPQTSTSNTEEGTHKRKRVERSDEDDQTELSQLKEENEQLKAENKRLKELNDLLTAENDLNINKITKWKTYTNQLKYSIGEWQKGYSFLQGCITQQNAALQMLITFSKPPVKPSLSQTLTPLFNTTPTSDNTPTQHNFTIIGGRQPTRRVSLSDVRATGLTFIPNAPATQSTSKSAQEATIINVPSPTGKQ